MVIATEQSVLGERQDNALDAGDSAAPTASSFLASGFSCSQAESTPAPAPQPAGLIRERKPLAAE